VAPRHGGQTTTRCGVVAAPPVDDLVGHHPTAAWQRHAATGSALAVAKLAADRGVRVFTVGFGSRDPMADTGEQVSLRVVLGSGRTEVTALFAALAALLMALAGTLSIAWFGRAA